MVTINHNKLLTSTNATFQLSTFPFSQKQRYCLTYWQAIRLAILATAGLFSPPGNDSFGIGLVFYCICFISPRYLRAASASRGKILHNDQKWIVFHNTSKILGALPQEKLGPKTSKIWCNFGWLQTLMANISGIDEDIWNTTCMWSTAIPTVFCKEVPWALMH